MFIFCSLTIYERLNVCCCWCSVDPFTKKDWYDVKAPSMFNTRNIGKTIVTRTIGTSLSHFLLIYDICTFLVVIADEWFHVLRSVLPFHGLSVLHCAQTAEYIDTNLHTTAPCLSQVISKFGWHRSILSFIFYPKVTHTPCWFECRQHSMANCSWMVRDSAMITMESL